VSDHIVTFTNLKQVPFGILTFIRCFVKFLIFLQDQILTGMPRELNLY